MKIEAGQLVSIAEDALSGNYWAWNALRCGVENAPGYYGEWSALVGALRPDYAEIDALSFSEKVERNI